MFKSGDQRNWKSILWKANQFVQETQQQVLQGINPGGIYHAIWCRDASYIIRDWFLCGNIEGAMQQIFLIWSHQIAHQRDEKLIYGRGSLEMGFSPEVVSEDRIKQFEGALPSTIYQAGFSEIYAQKPDIDSTALMISATSWILKTILSKKEGQRDPTLEHSSPGPIVASEHSSDYVSRLLSKLGMTDPLQVNSFVVPRMLLAVNYLGSRDSDEDGLLEQNHNEDWMDTMLRAGKIVYSQACWLLALIDLASLLSQLGEDSEARALLNMAHRTIRGVEEKLWLDESDCYADLPDYKSPVANSRALTQDISLYLVAITHEHLVGNTMKIDLSPEATKTGPYARPLKALDAMKKKIWKNNWPLVTEIEQKITGPRILKAQEYHNQTFWPWATATEMLARSRFNEIEECEILLSKLVSDNYPSVCSYYEWINPITGKGGGAYPFRTGVSAVRIAIKEILSRIETSTDPQHNKVC